ncbi:hypothetical protein [Pseudactinotalea suaedae]|uniref:hypothetical protein n=1 Tax=Pseudactinotalea suaedae TaxID=1524924 RepID=UPI0012E17EFD|nr:hypothetical protein [Pseudactinotalea suaedae]
MRSLRLGVALLAASAALLTGCTDPSPALDEPSEPPSSETSEGTSESPEPEEPSESATEADEPAPPVFGTSPTQPGGAATACVADALGAPLTFSTVLTAADPITLDDLTLDPQNAAEIEILDAYVLPFSGGAGGLAVGDYPPADPGAAREDVGGYPLAAGETVTVGVGVSAQSPTTMEFVLTYRGADGDVRTLTAQHEVSIAQTCTSEGPATETPTGTATG